MKKIIVIISILIIFFMVDVSAKVLTLDEFENDYQIERAYVVGNYLFDISNGFNPSLKDLLVASSYNDKNNINVYEIKITENINGEIVREYRELLQNQNLETFPNIDIKYIYAASVSNSAKNILDNKVLTHGVSRAGILNENKYKELNIERAYVLGEYIFNLDNGYNPSLKDLLIASTTVESDDIRVYEIKRSENINGDIVEEYNELLSFYSMNSYPTIKSHYVYSEKINSNNYDLLIKAEDMVSLTNKTETYNGSMIVHNNATNISGNTINYLYFDSIDCSGNPLNNAPKDAGNYSVKASTNDDEYYIGSSKCAKLSILPSNTVTNLDEITKTYNGSTQEASGATSKLSNNVVISDGNYTYAYYDSETNCTNEENVLSGAPANKGTYYVRATLVETANYKSSTSSCAIYSITANDVTKPVVSEIVGGTTPVATSQEIVLKCSDDVGVVGYYFGTAIPTSSDMINDTDILNEITSEDGYTKSDFKTNTKYYFACKDSAGNFNYKTISMRKYRVYNLVQKLDGESGKYTLNNYDRIKLENSDHLYIDYYIKYGEELTPNQVCSSDEIMNRYSDVSLSKYSFEEPNYDVSEIEYHDPDENIVINSNIYVACWYDREKHIDIRNSAMKTYYNERIFDNLDYDIMYDGMQTLTRNDGCWNVETGKSSCDRPAGINYTSFNIDDGNIDVYEYDENNKRVRILNINKNNNSISLNKYDASNDSQILIKTINNSSSLNNYIPLLLLPNKSYYIEQNGTSEFVHINSNLRMIKIPTDSNKYVRNMRDIGGLATDSNHDGNIGFVEYGKLFRGAAPDLGSEIDNSQAKEAFELLGIDVIYDVRKNRNSSGDILYPNYLGYGENDDGHYYMENGNVDDYVANFNARMVVKNIMDKVINNKNVFFHCTAGKDRTGTIAYLLEGILGISQADMLSDYALSYLKAPDSTNNFSAYQSLVESINSYDGNNDEEKFINWFLSFSSSDEEAESDIQLINRFREKMIYGEIPTVYVVSDKKCYAESAKVYFLNTLTNSVLDSPNDANESALIVSDGKYILLDTANEDENIRNNIIYKKLQSLQGVQEGETVTVDYLIVSHSDTDHTGNVKEILEDDNFEVKNIIVKYEAVSDTPRTSYEEVYEALYQTKLTNEDKATLFNTMKNRKGKTTALFTRNDDGTISESFIDEDGSSIRVGNLTMYFYNTEDVYYEYVGENINSETVCGKKKLALTFYSNTTKYKTNEKTYKYPELDENGNETGRYKYVYIDGSEYPNITYHITDYIDINDDNDKLPIRRDGGDSSNLMDKYFYAVLDEKHNCSANANSIVLLLEVDHAEHNRFIYLPSDLENNGYGLIPFDNAYSPERDEIYADEPENKIYGYGTRYIVDEDNFGIKNVNGIEVFEAPEDSENVRVPSESRITKRIKDAFGNNLQYIDIVQAAHHGLSNGYDSIGNLGLRNREPNSFYAIDTTRSNDRKTNMFHGVLSIHYNLAKANEIGVSLTDDDGVECTVYMNKETKCSYNRAS